MRPLAAALLLSCSCPAASPPLHFSSGPGRVPLLELYTSEGCSSCPPAEAWLSALSASPGLWKDFVPVEFHVNYWDQLGWKDRLSSRAFTDRQYAYSQSWGSRSVYTPCFVRDGAEWRPGWGSGAASLPAGTLAVELGDEGVVTAQFRPARPAGALELHLALLGSGLSSKVTAGENRGSVLGHDFAVLGLSEAAFSSGAAPLRADARLPGAAAAGARRLALAAWVTRSGDIVPIQATGGWLP